jgi:glycosyltransferase involved in cell wall biosynthesis
VTHSNAVQPVPAETAGTAQPAPLNVVIAEFLPSGGMFQFSFNLATGLANTGHHVTLLTGPEPEMRVDLPNLDVVSEFPTWHPNDKEETRPLWRKTRRVGRALRLAWSWVKLIRYTRKHRPDVVQLSELRFALDSKFAVLLKKYGRAKIMVDVAHNPVPYDVHGSSDSVEKADAFTLNALRDAYNAFDLMLALGPGPRDQLVKAFPDVKRTGVIPHASFTQYAEAAAAAPSPGSLPPRILFFGSWTRYKNIPLLLDAFAILRERLPAAELVIAGPVMPDVDLEAITATANALPGVRLEPGYVANDDVPSFFTSARVVALPYSIINISGIVHMAYTFGRPVVATDVGSMRDVVFDGETGLIAQATPEAFADALYVLLTASEDADRMGKAALEHITRELSWERSADAAVAGYRAALGR